MDDRTEQQSSDELLQARQLSLSRSRPPASVPGYEPQRYLGSGAYGEVWVAIDRNTGRQVAIKFYTHRGGLDWSLLSREVEKLVMLAADRYVVQLLDVGWDADPPYYVMEYLEWGSLDDRLKAGGPLPVDEAITIFYEVGVGLAHAHDKGVLHCDLKPANILLDQDSKPRLADFGQSKLSHEQTPSLGTLFYMAPEQADLEAVPDASWDVYGLGALLYCMLTGQVPRRNEEALEHIQQAEELPERLQRYRAAIHQAPPPAKHRKVAGVDRGLAEILDRCLALRPEERYPNVRAVLDALDSQARWRTWRPLVVLGAIGPALLVAVMGIFAWHGFGTAVQQSDEALMASVLQNNSFGARYVARDTANVIEHWYRAVEGVQRSEEFQHALQSLLSNSEILPLRKKLARGDLPAGELEALREKLRALAPLDSLAAVLEKIRVNPTNPKTNSWMVTDPQGVQLARVPKSQSPTVGRYYGWRTYFHGGPRDQPETWHPPAGKHLTSTHLSAVFPSQANGRWVVAVTTPVFDKHGHFLGAVGLTVEIGNLVSLEGDKSQQFAVLVDWRDGDHKGLIVQHPRFDEIIAERQRLPDDVSRYYLTEEQLPGEGLGETAENYRDPLAGESGQSGYNQRWLAQMAPIMVRKKPVGWLVIVQQSYERAIGNTLSNLKQGLWTTGMWALTSLGIVITAVWAVVIRIFRIGRRSTGRSDGKLTGVDTMTQFLPSSLNPSERDGTE